MRERILAVIEKNSRISVKELADLLGENEDAVAAELGVFPEFDENGTILSVSETR